MYKQRRKFLGAGLAAGGVAMTLPAIAQTKKISWRMVTTWPKNFPGLGAGANKLAKYITEMSGGELEVTVYGAGEIVPAFEAFDAVSKGTAEMGHGVAFYWKGKSPAVQFFAAVPFGLTAQEMSAWVYYGGGQQLWDELYGQFNLKPFLVGNTGVQMGGWFNREINSLDDIKGLKMRMPGLGGEVIGALGATPKALPGGEIFTSLQSGVIDATEWVGPYNDLAFGLYKAAKYYYYPGWHEPGTAIELFVNRQAYEALPEHLKNLVAVAAQAANMDMLADFTASNGAALDILISKHGVQLRRFPDEVLKALKEVSEEVVNDVANSDPVSGKVYASFSNFRKRVAGWTDLSEVPYSQARSL